MKELFNVEDNVINHHGFARTVDNKSDQEKPTSDFAWNPHKITRTTGKTMPKIIVLYHPHLFAETHIVPAIAVIFTLLYWTVAVLCYSNYLD